ncbi:Uncharacterized protein FWK35_00026474 [Aphis craccivora]|uniref:C2H2-type domain-containing protein n=1 Tax=Aphis craccivora TaxID=307492 RepID=A0A6G0W139_APHCR|nr:Uncharacterized protein FWK35_00026474 [Aphis craccivora]
MFNCDQCPSVFTAKHNLTVHQKKHAGVRFPCTVCPSTYSFKTSLNKHLKNAHGIINVTAHLRPLLAAPIIDQQTRPSMTQFAPLTTPQIQIAPQIFVPDVPDGGYYVSLNYPIILFIRRDILTLRTITENVLLPRTLRQLLGRKKRAWVSLNPPGILKFRRLAIVKSCGDIQPTQRASFKWAVLAKHMTGTTVYRIGENYKKHENKYNFDVPDVRGLSTASSRRREDRLFDLLLVTDGDNSHYVYISNFYRLIRKQKTGDDGRVVFCKRCFTSFDNQNLKYKLKGQKALDQHKLICEVHKPILPEMPKEGECLQFEAWKKTQRHPITEEKKRGITTVIQRHEAMSYGFLVKASDDVPVTLLEEYEKPTEPVIYRGSEIQTDVTKHFIETVTEIA